MRFNLSFFLSLLILLTLLTPFGGVWAANSDQPNAAAAPIQSDDGLTIVFTTANLRVRAQPTTSSPSLQIIPQGTTLSVLGRTGGSTWLQVEYKGVIGWISVLYVGTNDDLSALPVTDATDASVDPRPEERVSAPDGTLVDTGTLVVFSNFSNVNVRQQPNENAIRLTQLPQSQRATVTLLDPTYSWGMVTINGQTGWLALFVVNVLGDIRTVPVLGVENSGSDLPIPVSETLSLEQRALLDSTQSHLGRAVGNASSLIGIFSNAVNSSFIACGPQIPLFRDFRPQYELGILPELSAIIDDMHRAFDILNDARRPWVVACDANNTILFASQFSTWLARAQEGAVILDDVQRRLAVLSAR